MSALSGRVVSQFDGLPCPGVTVKHGSAAAVTTDTDGRFVVPGTADATVRPLTFSCTGFFTRNTRAPSGDGEWGIVPASFRMPAFDDVQRSEYGASTSRWVALPTVYIDSRPEDFTHPDVPTWLAEIEAQVPEIVAAWTGGVVRPAAVVLTDRPPADLAAGTIVVRLSESSGDYGGYSAAIGYARKSTLADRSIVAGTVHMRYKGYATNPGKRRGILAHELGHVLGMGHMNGTLEASVMAPSIGSKTDLKPFDHLIASLAYTREPGTTTPDTYTGVGGSTGGKPRRKRAGGVLDEELEETREIKVHKWVCGKDEHDKEPKSGD